MITNSANNISVNYLPLKSLIKLNWVLSLLASILIFTFLITITQNTRNAAIRFLQGFIFMGLTSFSNLSLFYAFLRGRNTIERRTVINFYLSSYAATIVIWLFVRPIYAAATGLSSEPIGSSVFRTYTPQILSIMFLNTLILVLQNLVILQHKKARGEIEILQLKANASETTNLLLRQQIHPHFLFNALNTIKSLYKEDLRQGESYLIHLANFLRVSISNQTATTVLIKNELEFCLDYLKMQKIRFDTALVYSISIPEETIHTCYLPYFSLQPLVENVLKHNELTEEQPIMITIEEIDGYLRVSNNLQSRNYKEPSTGYGLSNLAERYRLLAGEEGVHIESDHSFFTVSIKILNQ